MNPPRKKGGLNFEKSLKKLEQIVERLEDEQVPLEESLKLFAEGKTLTKACEAQLQEAENKVRRLMEDSEGNLAQASFATADSDQNDQKASDGDEKPKDGGDLPF